MVASIFYTDFKSRQTLNLGVDFLEILDRSVRRAAVRAMMLDFTANTGRHDSYGNLLEGWSSQSPQRQQSSDRWYRARFGYVIEAEANASLLRSAARRKWRCVDDRPASNITAGDFLLQTTGPRGELFPCDFRGPRGDASRPDVRVALGDRTEALFDITSRGEEGHVLEKGGGHWLEMPQVVFIAEVIYDEDEMAEDIFRGRAV